MRIIAAAVLALTFAAMPLPAAAEGCYQGGKDLSDLAGTYISAAHQMRVEVWPCNGFEITWDNAGGRHQAAYTARERMEGGGVVGVRMHGTPVTLDNANGALVTPAEPGWLEVWTASPYGDLRVYRLAKWR